MIGFISKRANRTYADNSSAYLKQLDLKGITHVQIFMRNSPLGNRKGCAICRANNGKEFPIDELKRFPEPIFVINHINCQCGFRPVPEKTSYKSNQENKNPLPDDIKDDKLEE